MNKIVEALKSAGIFYIATADRDQPRVRPFSSVTEFEGNVYICSNNRKKFYRQITDNNKVEICAMKKDGSWLRLTGRLVRDD